LPNCNAKAGNTNIVFLFSSCLYIRESQEQFVESPAKLLTSFHFRQLSGGVIMLNARFGNYPDTLNFILDTGSGGISLDSATVDYFQITPTPSDMTILGIAGIRKVSFIYNQKLRLPGLTVDSLNFHINNYDILTQVYGEKIDGIIGYSVLSRYIFNINYDSLKNFHFYKWTNEISPWRLVVRTYLTYATRTKRKNKRCSSHQFTLLI
jgi:hypothetical protein